MKKTWKSPKYEKDMDSPAQLSQESMADSPTMGRLIEKTLNRYPTDKATEKGKGK